MCVSCVASAIVCVRGLGNSLSNLVIEVCVCVSVVWLQLSCVFGDLETASGIWCLKCGARNSLRNLVIEVCVSVVWLQLSCVFGDLGTASGIGC